jgi:spermidine synthase
VTGTSMTILTVDTKLMPVLPLILRPNSKTNLTIAFGMGSAWRAALNAGLTSTVVELVPSVPEMFGLFYADAPTVEANPKGTIEIADGRNHVELTSAHYDTIVVDPPPPIETAGVSVISSLEFYQAAKARLNPGGVMMQWIPYGQTVDEFKAHVRSYASVYPYVIIAFGPGGYGMFMLGSDQPISFDPAAIQEVLSRPGIVSDLSSAADSPEHTIGGWETRIPQLVWIQGAQVPKFAGSGPLVTDDHPLPEYFLLRHLFGPPSPFAGPGLLQSLTPAP